MARLKPGAYEARFGPAGKNTPGPPGSGFDVTMYVVVAKPEPGVEVLQEVGRWVPVDNPRKFTRPEDIEGTCREEPKEITDGLR